jgi:tRNA(fMet)-specific endonuclease VapC
MKYLLDTNVCINILKGKSENVKNKISVLSNENIVIPSIVRFELYYGAFKSTQKRKTVAILTEFLNIFEDIVFDSNSAKICGEIRANLEKKGTPIGPYDLIIASITLSHEFILVTHNIKEFTRIDKLKIEDWEI